MRTTNVSVKGDRNYVRLLRKLAVDKDVRISDLVRAAIDEKYGDELEAIAADLFAKSGKHSYHLESGSEKVS